MIEIIAGTDRVDSNSGKVARLLLSDYKLLGTEANLIDLSLLDFSCAVGANYKPATGDFAAAVDRVSRAEGVVLVVPEYNGSYPGALKLFIDYWRYPESFEHRPVAFVGLGGRWGGLRPVEHLQQVFGYRNAYIFPNRVFISNVHSVIRDGKVHDPLIEDLLKVQSREFLRFVRGLRAEELSANARKKS